MRVGIIIVGIGQWEEYTKPLVESIITNEPYSRIVVVDNGSERKYPHYSGIVSETIRVDKTLNYASAINTGLYGVLDTDWFIVLNNDVICYAPFIKYLENLQDNIIYGNDLHYSNKRFEPPCPWVDGWLYVIPKKIIKDVGKWDEKFKIAGFEDADYCFRAFNKGYGISISELPFTHLGEHIRKSFYNYNQIRSENIEYLIEKHGLRKIS